MLLPVIRVWFLYHRIVGLGSPDASQLKVIIPFNVAVLLAGSIVKRGVTDNIHKHYTF